jgi:hypothetical protein
MHSKDGKDRSITVFVTTEEYGTMKKHLKCALFLKASYTGMASDPTGYILF